MRKLRSILTAALLAASPVAFAVDGVSFEYGKSDSSNSSVDLYRVGMLWDWNKKLLDFGNWHVGGFWDLSLGYWDNNSPFQTPGRSTSNLEEIGFTPTFRLQQNTISGFAPYAEMAVGFHFLSQTSVGAQRVFGSSFQFGDHIGVGVRFGDKGRYDIGYRYQHLSNAGIKQPNQGINYNILRLQYRF
jgi:hypothetical protein